MHDSDKDHATVIVLKRTRRNLHFIMQTLLIFKTIVSKKKKTNKIGLNDHREPKLIICEDRFICIFTVNVCGFKSSLRISR